MLAPTEEAFQYVLTEAKSYNLIEHGHILLHPGFLESACLSEQMDLLSAMMHCGAYFLAGKEELEGIPLRFLSPSQQHGLDALAQLQDVVPLVARTPDGCFLTMEGSYIPWCLKQKVFQNGDPVFCEKKPVRSSMLALSLVRCKRRGDLCAGVLGRSELTRHRASCKVHHS